MAPFFVHLPLIALYSLLIKFGQQAIFIAFLARSFPIIEVV